MSDDRHYLTRKNLNKVMGFCEVGMDKFFGGRRKVRITRDLFREQIADHHYLAIEGFMVESGMTALPRGQVRWPWAEDPSRHAEWAEDPSRHAEEYTKHQYGRFLRAVEILAKKHGTVQTGSTPQSQCPRCGVWIEDFDGFGVLAHIKPVYSDGCGYCSHPSTYNGRCGICSQEL